MEKEEYLERAKNNEIELNNHLKDQILPFYKRYSPNALPDFIDISGYGFQKLMNQVENLENINDLYSAPSEILKYLALYSGFEYDPDVMIPELERTLLRAMPHLIRMKGSRNSFEILATEIFDWNFELERTIEENTQTNYIYLRIPVDDETYELGSKQYLYEELAQYFRPLNTILAVIYRLGITNKYDYKLSTSLLDHNTNAKILLKNKSLAIPPTNYIDPNYFDGTQEFIGEINFDGGFHKSIKHTNLTRAKMSIRHPILRGESAQTANIKHFGLFRRIGDTKFNGAITMNGDAQFDGETLYRKVL